MDLNWVVPHLPGQDLLGIQLESMKINELWSLQDSLEHGCDCFLDNLIDTSSNCALIRARLEQDAISRRVHVTRKLRNYLTVPVIPAHRHALPSIMLCRLCRVDVENEPLVC